MVALKSQYEWGYGHTIVKLVGFQPSAILLFNWPRLNFAHLLRMTKVTLLFSDHIEVPIQVKLWPSYNTEMGILGRWLTE